MHKPAKTNGDTSWFVHDRFGMFIHWGLYALPGRHEWVKQQEEISDEQYDKYFRHFDPDLYDPRAWARAAKNAGMKYFVVTTKHHDGFCLWDTKLTDYKAPNTPYGKDLLRPMVEAFRDEGLQVGFYHSLIDWHHPHYPIDWLHAHRNNPDALKINKKRDIKKYAAYLHGQVEELLTQFGKIDILWFDFSYVANEWPAQGVKKAPGKGKSEWQSQKLIKMIRKLQPDIILNDRLQIDQDIKTPEQNQPRKWVCVNGKPVVWEACHTLSGSWGYHRDEMTWKSPAQLVQLLINSVACGGNLLMNVGPTGRGEFDPRALNALDAYAKWMQHHRRSIYGCTQSRFKPPVDCRFTQKGKRLYLHVFNWPFRHIHIDGLAGKVDYAQFLHDASEVRWIEPGGGSGHNNMDCGQKKGSIVLEVPIVKPDPIVPVIELILK